MFWRLSQLGLDVLCYLVLEEVVKLWSLSDLFSPGRLLELLLSLDDVHKVVEGKFPSTYADNPVRQIVHLQIDARGNTDLGTVQADRLIFHNEEVILESDEFRRWWYIKVVFLLIILIFIYGFAIEEERSTFWDTIVTDSIEICLTVCQHWNVYFTVAKCFISAYPLYLTSVIAEWYVFVK